MVAKIKSLALQGMDCLDIEIQISISSGLPAFNIVGLPDKSIKESKERIKAAISATGQNIPAKRITVNLAPANIEKEGSLYDLPIALGIMVEIGTIKSKYLTNYIILGELSLDGSIQPIRGTLSFAYHSAKQDCPLLCSKDSVKEISHIKNHPDTICFENLHNIITYYQDDTNSNDTINRLKQAKNKNDKKLKSSDNLSQIKNDDDTNNINNLYYRPILHKNYNFDNKERSDMQDVYGNASTKRMMEIAAAGRHHFLMIGPPGTGKSMMAKRFISIIPKLSAQEIIENNIITSIGENKTIDIFNLEHPFRSPHHSSSLASMIGGGKHCLPGEISLAHNGILFMDEMVEFSKNILESLRQPIENKKVSIARANYHITYPCNFQLIAAMNPCPCGNFGSNQELQCNRNPECAQIYQNKLSGPILDRIDLFNYIQQFTPAELAKKARGKKSDDILSYVTEARNRQKTRYKTYKNIHFNSDADIHTLRRVSPLKKSCEKLINKCFKDFNLSMRSYVKLIRVVRTIADLHNREDIIDDDIFEAVSYRYILPGRISL